MPHNITALILKGDIDLAKAADFDLVPIDLGFGLTLFHINGYYSLYWQYKLGTSGELDIVDPSTYYTFPADMSVAAIAKSISASDEPDFAIIQTDYFGGMGDQHACVFRGAENADRAITMISPALRYLGVTARQGLDEFDTVGLDKIRSSPDHLSKYSELVRGFED